MKLKIALLQTDIAWNNPSRNLDHIETMLAGLHGTDIAVLPEMFATGFITDSTRHGQSMDGEIVTRMRSLAHSSGIALAGTVAVHDDLHPTHEIRLRNRFVFVRPDGNIVSYDKHHLFGYGGENDCYLAGTQRVVFEYKGFRIMPQICYDLRFPVWSRNKRDYDLLLYLASWPTSRISAWDTLLKARAIENQCYVVGVNRVGTDSTTDYCGHSAIIDFKGHVIAAANEPLESCITSELDSEKLLSFREKFRVWEDADPFRIG